MCLEFDIDELYENQKPAYAQEAAEHMDEMFQWSGRDTTRRDWFCGLTDDIDQQSKFHKIDLGDFIGLTVQTMRKQSRLVRF